MKKFHVHVYMTPKMTEVDVVAPDEAGAMSQALAMIKSGDIVCDNDSPTKHLALAFPEEGYEQDS